MSNKERVMQTLNKYTGDSESLNKFINVVVEELGDNWPEQIYSFLNPLDLPEKERLDHAFSYYSATIAWEEIQSYLSQAGPLDQNLMGQRIPILEHWLAFFGQEGLGAVEELKKRLQVENASQGNGEKIENPQENGENENFKTTTLSDTISKEKSSEVLKQPVDKESEKNIEINEIENKEEPLNLEISEGGQNSAEEVFQEAKEGFQTQIKRENIFPIQEKIQSDPKGEKAQIQEEVQNPVLPPMESENKEEVKENKAPQRKTGDEKNILWLFDKIFLQIDLVKEVQEWMAARCYSLGDLEIKEYSYNGFLTDIQRQTMVDIKNILANPGIYPLLEQKKENAIVDLQRELRVLEKALEGNVIEEPLTKEEITKEEMRRTLGGIDESKSKEYLGPAPDGFEVIEDGYTEKEETKIKENYEKLEEEIEAKSDLKQFSPEKMLEDNLKSENIQGNQTEGLEEKKEEELKPVGGLRDMLIRPKPTEG